MYKCVKVLSNTSYNVISLHSSFNTVHCQVMPSMLQLISHSFWAKSSSEAALEHLAGAQSLPGIEKRLSYNIKAFVWPIFGLLVLCVPEVPPALAVQAWLHSAVDGGLCSLQCCLGKNPEDLHCHLDALVLMSPQVRLHHPRVQREHTHPRTCNTNKRPLHSNLHT